MAITPKSLADGQLPNTKTTLYTCPASTQTMLTVTYSATGAAARTVNCYLKRSGSTSRRIIPKDMVMDPSDCAYIDKEGRPFELSTGDVIEGDASTAAEVDYTIDGLEKSP